MKKKQLNFWQILTMNFGFFGVQFSFGLQQSNMSAIYKYLGAEESELPLLWLAGPVTGLIVQPIIGAISDGTWSPKFGRRKPFFLLGAVIASLALVAMPYSSSIWMAAGLLWILDAANNIALEPYRAFISDMLPKKQFSFGFLVQSFFTGLGTTLANFTPAILVSFGILALADKMDNGIPVYTYWAFGIGAIASIITILISVLFTKEYPPTPEELENLPQMMAEQYVCNFSIFQSLIDHWACKQLFPIAPIQRLDESPNVDATLVDITCDSEGKVSIFTDVEDIRHTIRLHELKFKEPYYLGVFLVGAYQDIMGDLHNLFGRVNEVHVFLEDDEEDGFYIEDSIKGFTINDVIGFTQYDGHILTRRMKKLIDRATKDDQIKPREGTRILDEYAELLRGHTYLAT